MPCRVVVLVSGTGSLLEALLTADPAIGAPDVVDAGMIQYLRTQRIVPAYQTRGYKLVELIRIYMAGTEQSP